MQNNEAATYIIDGEEKQPFLLQIIVGNGERGEAIPLSKLCKSPHLLPECMYEIQELKPLRLQFQGERDIYITFIWNKVFEGKKQDSEWKYQLHAKQSLVLIYEHGKTDYIYPWRCGIYHFEVHVNEEKYYGAFHITPKNFYDDQLTLIQQTVQEVIGSLIMDRGHYKKTFSLFSDLEDHSHMKTIRWLSQNISRIKQLYMLIEKDTQYENIEQKNRFIKKQTKRTARKNELLHITEGQRYWNRRIKETRQDPARRFVKCKTEEFLQMIEIMKLFLQENINKLQYMEESSKKEKNAIQTILQTIEKNGSVTERDKQKYKNIQLLKDTDMRKVSVKMQEYKVLYSIMNELSIYVSTILYSPFWNSISQSSIAPSSLRPIYQQFIHFMETVHQKTNLQSNQPLFLLVYKPTFLIYEYYVYFALLSILQDMGFVPNTPVKEQIQSYFYLDGLQDGTTVILEKEDIRLQVVFNELIETHPLIALSKGSNFYNGEDTKKPDIRIDYFQQKNKEWEYQSSVIVEVKYSPMYNIFQSIGNTKATEQMYKYWSIKYVEEKDGKRVFHRRAIYEVVCVYPGSQVHAKKIESGCGVFLQFYPYKTKQGIELLMGKREFIKIFEEWLFRAANV
jgi:hypothetical protein